MESIRLQATPLNRVKCLSEIQLQDNCEAPSTLAALNKFSRKHEVFRDAATGNEARLLISNQPPDLPLKPSRERLAEQLDAAVLERYRPERPRVWNPLLLRQKDDMGAVQAAEISVTVVEVRGHHARPRGRSFNFGHGDPGREPRPVGTGRPAVEAQPDQSPSRRAVPGPTGRSRETVEGAGLLCMGDHDHSVDIQGTPCSAGSAATRGPGRTCSRRPRGWPGIFLAASTEQPSA